MDFEWPEFLQMFHSRDGILHSGPYWHKVRVVHDSTFPFDVEQIFIAPLMGPCMGSRETGGQNSQGAGWEKVSGAWSRGSN